MPQEKQSTWATVVRKGQKKVRVITPQVPVTPYISRDNQRSTLPKQGRSTNIQQNATGADKFAPTDSKDKGIFLRVPQEHEWRKLSPAGIREVLIKKLAISPASIGRIKPINSGFALSPSNNDARELIMKAEHGLFLPGTKLELATNYEPVIIPTVPACIHPNRRRPVRDQ
ncbi:putative eka-like protein [Erysiphe necator]|uniref:Putative eka-like protein n=1 Tax=Uncinula necator TaxID=52586 RepID=A0A0B1P114_UNCNE|nr:putative eka-like protein [Erysiphe necator]